MRLIVVSGHSGAGKSVALRVLEDMGYYCVDNLPVNLLESFIQSVSESKQNVAVSIDVRNIPKKLKELTTTLQKLKSSIDLSILFLDADKATLLKRYSETRRVHPLSLSDECHTLDQALDLEKKMLKPLKEIADILLNSSNQSLHDLSEDVRYRIEGKERNKLIMVFESFGFKFGLPTDADYVFDVRFLPNPHWEPALRPMTGLDAPIKTFLESHDEVLELKRQIQTFIEHWLPLLEKNNRSYLTVAIGCTGGKHRSVYLTQQIGEYFAAMGHTVKIRHTTLEKRNKE
ncbi:TPA: RNase adapter RapZ [Vibrio vulnificus]|nr:RNase adapter RapZ [Vibrio vulnificus]HDY7433452.1 RNase adapter RapZ [Vibrio vulnificus]HDY7571304.1 RNase adapter RapZ [Vibrio vulnificus]HDY8090541.1 RNase adapter RapZ [Vibrio vulnificus]HDY8113252.1 RNase adapter RapZ [Vibrio vulnificus]